MRRFIVGALALVALSAAADVVNVSRVVNLYRGTTILERGFASEAECMARADELDALRRYRCRTDTTFDVIADEIAPPPPPPDEEGPPPTPTGDARISVSPASYAVGGYTTVIWDGQSCVKSSSPAYSVWDSTAGDDGGRSLAPNVTTVFTLACANGTASATLTVSGLPEDPPPPPSGGGSDPTPPPPTTLPVPTVLATPIALTVAPLNLSDPSQAWAVKYAETARRNWSFEGHEVVEPFDSSQGYWTYEPCTGSDTYPTWLFDRPQMWFKLAQMVPDDPSYLAQAISDFRYWAGKIDWRGFFSCKTGEDDTKYLNIRSFLDYERATGDTSLRPVADRVYTQSAQGFSTTYSSGLALWTEREVGIHGDAALAYYELTGNTQALARAAAMIRQWDSMAAATGAPLVSYTQHEGGGPGGTQPADLINSPWMSAFYLQFARRYWQITGDEMPLRHASRYFDWLDANGLYDGSLFHPQFAGVTVPRYLAPSLIGDGGYDEGNLKHCADVMGVVAFAVLAKQRLGEPTARAEQRLTEMRGCTARAAANWTRDTIYLPKYRLQAPREINWQIPGLYESQVR